MADENTATNTTNNTGGEVEQPAQAADTAPAQEKPDMSIEDYKAALAKANAEAAKYRVERNEFRDDAQKFREIQEAEKTDLQRAEEALAAARAESQKYQVELARSQALAKYGISEDNADLLGADPEKFEANAARIGALQAEAAKKAAPPSDYPIEDMKPGASTQQDTPDLSYPAHWPVSGPFAHNS